MNTIDNILREIGEDKYQNLSTTSFEFKRALWNFFQGYNNKVAVEFGTNKGQTSRLLSYLFRHVYTVNINDSADAKILNHDRNNISYITGYDLYNNANILPINEPISMFFIDAGHRYHEIVQDINRACSMPCTNDCYLVFDDYGSPINPGIKQAVLEAEKLGFLKIIQYIGCKAYTNFGTGTKGGADRILEDYEGVITKVIWSNDDTTNV